MSWGNKRRNSILLIFFIIFFAITAGLAFLYLYEEPTCFDNKRNGSETGIDCGGSCALVCSNETLDLFVHWKRYFEVSPGVYNVIAYVENKNPDAGINNIQYEFKLFDTEGTPLDQRTGSFSIKPKEIIPIIQNNLLTGELKPVRLDFTLNSDFTWQKMNPRRTDILIADEQNPPESFTKITAKLINTDISQIDDISSIIIVYDENNNAIASSSTFVEKLSGGEDRQIVFTWPANFNDQIFRWEILPIYD